MFEDRGEVSTSMAAAVGAGRGRASGTEVAPAVKELPDGLDKALKEKDV